MEQNPVKAGLTDRPEDWLWSSARAHLTADDDVLVAVTPLLERVADWAAFLNAENEPDVYQTMHRHARTGRPLGLDAFLSIAERLTGRALRRKKTPTEAEQGKACLNELRTRSPKLQSFTR